MPFNPNAFSEEEEQKKKKRGAQTPQQVAQTAQRADKPEGFVTQTGQVIEGVANALNPMNYTANLIDAGQNILKATGAENTLAGQFLEGAGEIFKTQQELDTERTAQIQRVQAGDTQGIPEGQQAYAAISPKIDAVVSATAQTPYLPLSLAARVAGQDAPWMNKPASIADDDPLADTIYEISRVLAPTLVAAPVLGALSVPAGLAAESLIETIPQTSAEDMVAGRTLAGKFGELYDAMGLDLGYENGSELTRDLIEGKTPAAQALLAVWGFGQNYGINWSAGKLIEIFGDTVKPVFTRGKDWIAERLGKSVDEVENSLINIKDPEYTSTKEPSEVVTPGDVVPRATSTTGSVLNDAGLLQRMLRDIEDLPDVARAPGEFFTDWTKLSKSTSIQEELKKAFSEIPGLELGATAKQRIQKKTLAWLINNRALLSEDLSQFMMKFKDDFTIDIGSGAHRIPFDGLDAYMRKYLRMDYGGLGTGDPEAGYVGIAVSRYILEDLGYSLQKVASQMDDMLQRNEDITPMMRDVFIPLENFTQTFAHPFRHAKRDWFLRGETQQLNFLEGTEKGLDEIQTELDDLAVMDIDGVPTKTTIADLWEAAQNGDVEAFDTLKTYVKNLAFGDPAKVIADNEISTKIIEDQLKKKNAGQKFFYNGMMLGQWATQVNAAVPTVFRQIFEPLALAGSPNFKDVSVANRMYGLGQFYGGFRYQGAAWKALFRALNTNKPAAGYAKYTNNYSSDLLKEVAEIRRYHARLQIEMINEGATVWERLGAHMWGLWQTAMYHPAANLPTRGLMATDEAARVTAGVQVATGRAMRDAHLGKIKPDQIEAQTKAYFKQIFKGPPAAANIKDPEVKVIADRITMQSPLEISDDSSILEKYFAAEDAAAKMDPVHRFFSPFNRVAFSQIDQELMSMTGQVPGAQMLIGVADKIPLGPLEGLNPYKKYQKLYKNSDPTQKLQLESQLALSQWLTMSTVATIVMGGKITGSDVRKGEPANSIIVPAPWTRKGEIAIPYSKFSPYGVVLNNVANWVRAVETGAWSHQQYGTAIAGLVFGYATYGLNRAVLQGQQQLQKILDMSNFEPWLMSAGDVLTSAVTPGIGREIGELINPFQTIKEDRTSPGDRFLSGLAEKGVRSFYAPPMYDIYAKEKTDPETRVAQQAGGNGFQRRMSVMLNMLYPGNITETDYSDPIQTMMRAVNYEANPNLTTRIYGAYLNKQQQSDLRREMQGLLYKNLEAYGRQNYMYKGREVGKWAKYKKLLNELGPESNEVQTQLAKILSDIEDIHFKTKLEAATRAGFGNDPVLRDEIEKSRLERMRPEISSSQRQGLYASAAKEETPFAQQVRKILDIA